MSDRRIVRRLYNENKNTKSRVTKSATVPKTTTRVRVGILCYSWRAGEFSFTVREINRFVFSRPQYFSMRVRRFANLQIRTPEVY